MSRPGNANYNTAPQTTSHSIHPPPIPTSQPLSGGDRTSTASAYPLSSIGNMLATPYDDDDDGYDSEGYEYNNSRARAQLQTRVQGQGQGQGQTNVQPLAHGRGYSEDSANGMKSPVSDYGTDSFPAASTATAAGDRRQSVARQVPAHHLRSFAGELDSASARGTPTPTQSQQRARGSEDTLRANSAQGQVQGGIMRREGDRNGNGNVGAVGTGKRVTIVDFPTPSLGGAGRYDSLPNAGAGAGAGNAGAGTGYMAQGGYVGHQQHPTGTGYNDDHEYRNQHSAPAYPSPSRPGLFVSHSHSSGHVQSSNPSHHPHPSPLPSSQHAQQQYQNQHQHQTQRNYHPHPHPHPQHLCTDLPPPRPLQIDLPPPQSPISPLLAAPPSHSLKAPSPSFLGPAGRTRDSVSSTNESIRGFDAMKEKNALFRGGEEELLAFSPRPRMRARPGRTGMGVGRAASRLMTTVDFWKRFSVMRIEGEREEKESEWLSTAQGSRASIKKWILIGLVILAIVIAAIIVAVIIAT